MTRGVSAGAVLMRPARFRVPRGCSPRPVPPAGFPHRCRPSFQPILQIAGREELRALTTKANVPVTTTLHAPPSTLTFPPLFLS
jgi:hypothetical protein